MCADNIKDAGVNKSSKSLWNSTTYVYVNPYHGTNKIPIYYMVSLTLQVPLYPPNILHVLESPHHLEICADIWEQFERIYIRVNTYHKTKTTSKIKQ